MQHNFSKKEPEYSNMLSFHLYKSCENHKLKNVHASFSFKACKFKRVYSPNGRVNFIRQTPLCFYLFCQASISIHPSVWNPISMWDPSQVIIILYQQFQLQFVHYHQMPGNYLINLNATQLSNSIFL